MVCDLINKSCNYFSGIVENVTEFRPELCIEVAKQGFMQWILKRLKLKVPFDGNKLYATEILSILLQNTPENRKLLGELDGIDVLLQQLAVSWIHNLLYFSVQYILRVFFLYCTYCYNLSGKVFRIQSF